MNEESTISSARVYDGQVIKVRLDTVRLSSGHAATREIVTHPSSICAVPVDADSNVILVRQYRKAAEATLLEVPAGKMEANEEPEAAARRELREEIGHTARTLTRLGGFYVAPAWCTQFIHAYLATDLSPARSTPDDDEFITFERIPFSDVAMLLAEGQIRDAKSISALLLAMRVMGDN